MSLLVFSRSGHFETEYFRMSRWVLRFLGLWTLDPITKLTVMVIGFNFIVLLMAIIGEIRYAWLIGEELLEALVAICPCLTKAVTLMKLVYFLAHRQDFALLFKDLQLHLIADTKDSTKNGKINRTSFVTNICSFWLWFFAVTTNFFYFLIPIVTWTYQRVYGVDNSGWVILPFQAALPYKDMTQLENKPLYTLVYCLLAHSGSVTTFGFSGIDGAFLCFCMYITVCHQCLQEDFKEAFKRHVNSAYQKNGGDLLYRELSRLVNRQQNIIKLFKNFNGLYKLMIFGQFLLTSIVLGITLFNLLLTPGISKIIYVFYFLGIVCQLYSYCYVAEELNECYLKLSETLYFCEWYRCDIRTRKLILLVMINSQRGCQLEAPFFKPSIPLFGAIVRTSASYITVLKTFL